MCYVLISLSQHVFLTSNDAHSLPPLNPFDININAPTYWYWSDVIVLYGATWAGQSDLQRSLCSFTMTRTLRALTGASSLNRFSKWFGTLDRLLYDDKNKPTFLADPIFVLLFSYNGTCKHQSVSNKLIRCILAAFRYIISAYIIVNTWQLNCLSPSNFSQSVGHVFREILKSWKF